MRALLNSLNEDLILEKSKLLVGHLKKLFISLAPLNHDHPIGVFAPMKREPNWRHGFEWAGDFAFPAISSEGAMLFKRCAFDQLEVKSDFGVELLGPPKSAAVVTPQVLLIPGLAFSLKGERLGKGKGYYDKYLDNFKGLKIGLAFNEQIFPSVPVEAHDHLMDWIVSDSEVLERRR